ncbi:Shedu immune nuclease family protein [Phormidesmis sp. 146-12]
MAQAVVNLQEESDSDRDAKVQKILNALVGVDKLKQIFKVWKTNQNNSSELFWQKLLSENSCVLSQIFSTPVTILSSEAYVGGREMERTGSKIIDFLMVNNLTRNTSLIEIKTPTSRLLGKEYRKGVYNPSSDLVGAVTQVSTSRDSWIKDHARLVSLSDSDFEAFNPLCIVISGHAGNELLDKYKRRSFELYRADHRNVQIVTYDEVFEKIKTLVEILEGKN